MSHGPQATKCSLTTSPRTQRRRTTSGRPCKPDDTDASVTNTNGVNEVAHQDRGTDRSTDTAGDDRVILASYRRVVGETH